MLDYSVAVYAIVIYATLTYIFKLSIFKQLNLKKPREHETIKWKERLLVISPDLWWAFKFKNRIHHADSNTSIINRKKFVIENNNFNLWFSLALGTVTLTLAKYLPESLCFKLILSIAITRFTSRSIEITYAFVRDAFQSSRVTSATNLGSKERIKLAAKSYIEIYFFSAPTYLILTKCIDPWAAISLSLNVGTLTNVGLAFSDPSRGFEANIVFFQVFTTLSLVVFSFAMYLARPERE